MADWQYAGSDAFGTSANTVKYNHRQQEPMQAPHMGSITVKQIAVNGVPATMQLDTQSVVTRISAQLWEELKSLRLIDDSPSACEVTCPSGAKVQFRGMTRIVISIAGKKVETTAFVEDLGDDMDLFLATNVLNDIPLRKELWQAIGMEDLAPAAVSNVSPPNGFEPAAGTPEQQQMKKKTKHRRSMPCMFAQTWMLSQRQHLLVRPR
ncbi:hypothetical protein AAVH_09567 [Aphelenchoides avenae]|nr:hypothetical protein AAVH_20841 [Aphelenchus avenae]KAH7722911.1 hypothetical protein AAVH_09567 [Aphelenchus avenae]